MFKKIVVVMIELLIFNIGLVEGVILELGLGDILVKRFGGGGGRL